MKVYISYEIRQIDALYYDDEWVYNETYRIDGFKTRAKDEKRAFLNRLKKLGIRFTVPIRVIDCFDGFEIINRKTGEPLFMALSSLLSLGWKNSAQTTQKTKGWIWNIFVWYPYGATGISIKH